jgi:hypothetical protein
VPPLLSLVYVMENVSHPLNEPVCAVSPGSYVTLHEYGPAVLFAGSA